MLHWLIIHWKAWGIPAVLGSIATWSTWFLTRKKEWTEARRVSSEGKIDARVIEVMLNRELWTSPRGMTGAGDPLIRSGEIAEALSIDGDKVADSLERLERRGKVVNSGGTLDNPSPNWHIVHR